MRYRSWIAGLLLVLALPTVAQVPQSAAPTPTAAAEPSVGPELTAADVNAWLDGFMPYALATGDIAGAVVVVVKDGQVLTQRGFGYADVKSQRPVDPATTLFRPGSISKLFTWTAVMQLVQAGKLDLDADVNTYLDYKIPSAFGKPVTLRHLMTHTAGFEESAKNLLVFDPAKQQSLEALLKLWVPNRIYAPGSMAAYSNYGASLAGYIVQRVSGERFETYVQQHIFAPLGMTLSTFEQPLPPALAATMASGYNLASQDAGKFEIIGMSPAGALSSSGADMAKFMIAHLSGGGALLDPATAQQMHAAANTPIPGLPAMALGFYHEDRNGLTIVGHGGDTEQFHSDLHLYLDKNVGLYLSFNSAGKEGAAHIARESLFVKFTDRYFPMPATAQPESSTAAEHGRAMVGHYVSSRGSMSSFLRLAALLSNASVVQNADHTITVSALTNPAGVPKRWREVSPWQWQEVGGEDRLGAVFKDGRVSHFSIAGLAPIIEFIPAPTGLNAGWILPLALIALGVLLLTALSWPIVAWVRRSYGYRAGIVGRALTLHRATRVTAWILLAITAGWLLIFMAITNDVTALDGRLDKWMRLLQLLTLVAIAGAIAAIWNAWQLYRTHGRRRWATVVWSILIALSAVFLCWLAFDAGLVTPTLDY